LGKKARCSGEREPGSEASVKTTHVAGRDLEKRTGEKKEDGRGGLREKGWNAESLLTGRRHVLKVGKHGGSQGKEVQQRNGGRPVERWGQKRKNRGKRRENRAGKNDQVWNQNCPTNQRIKNANDILEVKAKGPEGQRRQHREM